MMSNKHVFPDIGDINREDDIEKIFDAQVLNSEHLPDGLDFRSVRFSVNEKVIAHRERLLEDEFNVVSFFMDE